MTAVKAAVAATPDDRRRRPPSALAPPVPHGGAQGRPDAQPGLAPQPQRRAARLTFDGRAQEAVTGLERRRIRYRLVSLLDMPDEVRGVEIGSLDEGDEVVLMEKRGTYWRVLCPDGREGWLHKMTLGDAVIESAPDTWTSADEGPAAGGFEDILRAYTESRRQFGEA